jgi:hypothetical protein
MRCLVCIGPEHWPSWLKFEMLFLSPRKCQNTRGIPWLLLSNPSNSSSFTSHPSMNSEQLTLLNWEICFWSDWCSSHIDIDIDIDIHCIRYCTIYRMAATLCVAVTIIRKNHGADWQIILMIHMMRGMMLYFDRDHYCRDTIMGVF